MKKQFPWQLVLWYIFFVVLVFGLDEVRYHHHSLFYLFHHFDKLLHTGAGIASGIFAWMWIDWFAPSISNIQKFFIVMGCVVIVGVSWEILERLFPLLNTKVMLFDPIDTTTDVLSDILGGLILFTYTLL